MAQTLFSRHNAFQFTSLFRAQIWGQLTPQMKYQACQELENRLAAERNMPPRTIVAEKMDGACYGYQSGDRIYINQYLLEDGCFVTHNEITGAQLNRYPMESAGWQMYDTICHEDEHGAQIDRGDAQTFKSYITFDKDSALYRIQKDEARAFAVGNMRTLDAIEMQKNAIGIEPDMMAYVRDIKADRYYDALAEAQVRFHDENIKEVLDQFIEDAENGESGESTSGTYSAIQSVVGQKSQMANLHSVEEGDVLQSGLFSKPFDETEYLNPEYIASSQGTDQLRLPEAKSASDGSEIINDFVVPQINDIEDGASLMLEENRSEIEFCDDGSELFTCQSEYDADYQESVEMLRNDYAGYSYETTDYGSESYSDQASHSDSDEYSSGQGMSR